MDRSTDEIKRLELWLEENLDFLAAHAEGTAQILHASDGSLKTAAPAIIRFASAAVIQDGPAPRPLSEEQRRVWKSLLPLLAAHGLLLTRAAGSPKPNDEPLSKAEAARALGISVRKLEKHMRRREIGYEKYGAGQSAPVRFSQAHLAAFRNRSNVAPRQQTR
jgi:hypothetical protein